MNVSDGIMSDFTNSNAETFQERLKKNYSINLLFIPVSMGFSEEEKYLISELSNCKAF